MPDGPPTTDGPPTVRPPADGPDPAAALTTVGHGTHTEDGFAGLLSAAGVREVVDIRIAPGSRRNPQFGRDELARWLPEHGIAYRWERRLGGFRKLPPDSPDVALINPSFRAYAAHMRTGDFREAMDRLRGEARHGDVAVMCSESVWWRCHRRLLADHAVLVDSLPVRHLMPDGRLSDHRVTPGARLEADELVYDAGTTLPLVDRGPGEGG